MAQVRYYSPRLDRALVSRLYFEAKARRIPMTVLTNRLVEEALSRRMDVGESAERDTVAGGQPTTVD